MKRKDALHKVRTICQRLDEADDTFPVQPLSLYLHGSVLTDKPDPKDVDLILIYEYPPGFDFNKDVTAMMYHQPTAVDRAIIQLRRGLKMIRISPVRRCFEDWPEQSLLLTTHPRLIWRPGAAWPPALDEIEAAPLAWPGPRPSDAAEQYKAWVERMPIEEYEAKIAKAIAEIEAQDLAERQ